MKKWDYQRTFPLFDSWTQIQDALKERPEVRGAYMSAIGEVLRDEQKRIDNNLFDFRELCDRNDVARAVLRAIFGVDFPDLV